MNKFIMPLVICLPLIGWSQQKASLPLAAQKQMLQASIARGKTVYASFCLTCHQADGSGVSNMNPPLIKTKWVLGSKEVLISQVLHGSKGKVVIDGDIFHNAMPPLAALTDVQIADVLTYARNSFGNRATMVSPAQVKTIRAKTK